MGETATVGDHERRVLIEQIIRDREAIFRAMRGDWSKELLTTDLTLPQLRVLFLLETEGSQSMSSLAEALGKAQTTVTGLIDRLVESGLVARAEHQADRRVTIAHLTAAGHDLMAGITQASGAHTRQLVGHLPAGDLQLVADAFALLRREAVACSLHPRPRNEPNAN